MTRLTQIEDILGRLSAWEREYGTRFSADPRLKSTGESNAAIAEFKRKLDELGARYHWQEPSQAYVLDSVGTPPGSEGEPA
jgi:hypothetical protein